MYRSTFYPPFLFTSACDVSTVLSNAHQLFHVHQVWRLFPGLLVGLTSRPLPRLMAFCKWCKSCNSSLFVSLYVL